MTCRNFGPSSAPQYALLSFASLLESLTFSWKTTRSYGERHPKAFFQNTSTIGLRIFELRRCCIFPRVATGHVRFFCNFSVSLFRFFSPLIILVYLTRSSVNVRRVTNPRNNVGDCCSARWWCWLLAFFLPQNFFSYDRVTFSFRITPRCFPSRREISLGNVSNLRGVSLEYVKKRDFTGFTNNLTTGIIVALISSFPQAQKNPQSTSVQQQTLRLRRYEYIRIFFEFYPRKWRIFIKHRFVVNVIRQFFQNLPESSTPSFFLFFFLSISAFQTLQQTFLPATARDAF